MNSKQRYCLRHPERVRESKRRYRMRHLEKMRAYGREHHRRTYEKRREEMQERARMYYAAHRERCNARNRSYREEHSKQIKARQLLYNEAHRQNRQLYCRRYRAERPGQFKEARRAYYLENCEQLRTYSRNRTRVASLSLSDFYVTNCLLATLPIRRQEITIELIRSKRDILIAKRLLRRLKKEAPSCLTL